MIKQTAADKDTTVRDVTAIFIGTIMFVMIRYIALRQQYYANCHELASEPEILQSLVIHLINIYRACN